MTIDEAIRRRYSEPEWAYFTEFTLESRRLDGLAINLWRSRGHAIVGFEVKTDRGDWLRELKTPAKAEEGSAFCDAWFLVTPKDIAKPEEVPAAWGWLEMRGDRLFTRKEATPLTAVPITREFLVRTINAGAEGLRRDRMRLRDEVHAELRAEHEIHIQNTARYAKKELEEIREKVAAFQDASGISIGYSVEKARTIGARVRAVEAAGWQPPNLSYDIERVREALRGLEEVDALLKQGTAVEVTP